MTSKKGCIMVGAGGFAGAWIRNFLPPFSDRLTIVALVDINRDALASSGDFLGLPEAARFSNMEDAFDKVEADFCIIVIPPALHREAAVLAVSRKTPILTEKPIADTWEACLDIYSAVTTAGVKTQVVQNYRFTPPILTLKKALKEQRVGVVNYLVARFAADYRQRSAWGKFRHEIPHALLVEGSVHHFDQIRNLTESDCRTVAGWEWNPHHPSFDGECCGLFVMHMTNGAKAQYEGNCLEAGRQNNWHQEYYRAECENGAVVLDNDGIVRILEHTPGRGLNVEELSPVHPRHDGHCAIIHQFLEWLDGGPEPPTAISDNLKSAALLFGAIEASVSGAAVNVATMMDDVMPYS